MGCIPLPFRCAGRNPAGRGFVSGNTRVVANAAIAPGEFKVPIDIRLVLRGLAAKRKLFHSEADFQHALAWEIHERYPDCSIRLEFTPSEPSARLHVDIWIAHAGTATAIELKYKTRRLRLDVDGEAFHLNSHGAQDTGRYDFLKDVYRLERITSATGATGYAVLLTNDSAYWVSPRGNDTVYAAFQIHEGRHLEGTMSWASRAGAGTMRDREEPIPLQGHHVAHWEEYSQVQAGSIPYARFRYLLVEVG